MSTVSSFFFGGGVSRYGEGVYDWGRVVGWGGEEGVVVLAGACGLDIFHGLLAAIKTTKMDFKYTIS
jgi:hypothetical protein